jgi:hypothetical protein
MSKKSRKSKLKRKKKQRGKSGQSPLYISDYYQPILTLLIQSIGKTGYNTKAPHSLRNSFWKLLPYDTYPAYHAREIIKQYAKIVEKEIGDILSKHSIAYWLHLYRRLSPTPFGPEKDSTTVFLIRATLEAAIQKYGLSQQCNRVGFSNQVPMESILKGALMAPELKYIRDGLKDVPQLALTDFGTEELIEFYEVQKLAFELWRCAATLRILGKGAGLCVVEDPIAFYDDRSEELDKLVTIYDKRIGGPMGMSATGTVFPQDFANSFASGAIFLPRYNVNTIPFEILNNYFRQCYGFKFPPKAFPNFIWGPFNLAGYFAAHKPFAESFEKTHGIPLTWIIGIVGAMAYRVWVVWQELGALGIYNYWKRGYEGPLKRTYIIEEIEGFLGPAAELFGLKIDPKQVNIQIAANFLELNDKKRRMIDVLLAGPHSMFLPFNDDRIFIDYAWSHEILYHLFYNIKVSDQNFKGDALEQIVHKGISILPTGPCHALNGEIRQIDAAFEIDDILLIIECRAVAKSLGVERGDPEAIQYRIDLLNRTLSDIDEKAYWLAQNPVGTNYDIRKYKIIMPIGVTPFVEYLPSLDPFYWIDTIPRVLTPDELKRNLEDQILKDAVMKSVNRVTIPSI